MLTWSEQKAKWLERCEGPGKRMVCERTLRYIEEGASGEVMGIALVSLRRHDGFTDEEIGSIIHHWWSANMSKAVRVYRDFFSEGGEQ